MTVLATFWNKHNELIKSSLITFSLIILFAILLSNINFSNMQQQMQQEQDEENQKTDEDSDAIIENLEDFFITSLASVSHDEILSIYIFLKKQLMAEIDKIPASEPTRQTPYILAVEKLNSLIRARRRSTSSRKPYLDYDSNKKQELFVHFEKLFKTALTEWKKDEIMLKIFTVWPFMHWIDPFSAQEIFDKFPKLTKTKHFWLHVANSVFLHQVDDSSENLTFHIANRV